MFNIVDGVRYRRIFEGMSCGKMVLCDRLDKSKKLDELFVDGEDIVYYNDMIDCIEKMNKYSEDKVERDKFKKMVMIKYLKIIPKSKELIL